MLDASVTEQHIIDEVNKLQNDPKISGVMVQLPLPKHVNEEKIINFISPFKDIDGLHPYNIGSK